MFLSHPDSSKKSFGQGPITKFLFSDSGHNAWAASNKDWSDQLKKYGKESAVWFSDVDFIEINLGIVGRNGNSVCETSKNRSSETKLLSYILTCFCTYSFMLGGINPCRIKLFSLDIPQCFE